MANYRSHIPLALIILGGLLILGAFILVTFENIFSIPTPTTPPELADPQDGIPRVNVGDAKAAYDLKSAVFLDVRDNTYYQEQHIPGALSIPLNELENRLNELNPEDWIITYCT